MKNRGHRRKESLEANRFFGKSRVSTRSETDSLHFECLQSVVGDTWVCSLWLGRSHSILDAFVVVGILNFPMEVLRMVFQERSLLRGLSLVGSFPKKPGGNKLADLRRVF